MFHKFFSPARKFFVGKAYNDIEIQHCATLWLQPNEMITFAAKDDLNGYDITCKDWGYYLTQSINSRLSSQDLKVFVIEGIDDGKQFIVSVKADDASFFSFNSYLNSEKLKIIHCFD